MNILDVKNVPISENYLKDIFQRQWELIDKYHDIEHKVMGIDEINLDFREPINIDNAIVQFKLKGHLARVAEEIAESYEIIYNNDPDEDGRHFKHLTEESIDGLHFLLEAMIMMKVKWEDLDSLETLFNKYQLYKDNELSDKSIEHQTEFMYNRTFYHLLITFNTLKMKPWKVTPQITDQNRFFSCLKKSFEHLIYLIYFFGLKPEDVYELYMKKSEVNMFRMRSNY